MVLDAPVVSIKARSFTIPTDRPEADGTLSWSSTTLVLVEAEAADRTGIGYTYADAALLPLINNKLAGAIRGQDAFDPQRAWRIMQGAVRNLGADGLAATAISAVDAALWDLKAKLLDVPLATLLGRFRSAIPVYGSGGFTSYPDEVLRDQLAAWVERDGCRAVKMKIGSEPDRDPERVRAAKDAIGGAALFVDANGGFGRKQAVTMGERFADQGVAWFEEPVSSDDLDGLRFVRDHLPASMEVAAGEYGYRAGYFARMLGAGAVDVLQADISRCGGVTGFMLVAALCEAEQIDLSCHCAPALHLHAGCAAPRLRHLEWFHDHVRIEQMLFDGAPVARNGVIAPDLSRPGHGISFKEADARPFAD
ncbi:enolase C-terminal domain-like protein [Rhizosaccharibacter radicis]|uniref:Mandelate racemase n=1 Tax=Rhizosaccharibacter radicis TaxID=2782605 RepID=A0ABT1VWC0_9PROT|nr:mandelate racemase [Acetobacteraceae bacterium KSS12]